MDPALLSDAFALEATSLLALAGLQILSAQDAATDLPPLVVFQTECDKLNSSGKSGFFRVSAIVKSMVADTAAHAARVELIRAAFVDGKADRVASINGRGALRLIDYGAVPAKNEVTDGHAVTTLVLKTAARLV